MHSSMVKKLFFHFIFCQLVTSSRYSFLKNETLSNESVDDFFDKFFVDLNEAYTESFTPRHMAVLGASTIDLKQVQPLFEIYPYSICQGTERCVYSKRFTERTWILIFLEDFREETIRKKIKNITPCKNCDALFIFDGIIRLDDVSSILTLATRHHLPYSKFAHLRKNAVDLYTDFVANDCTTGVRLATVWRPGVFLDEMTTWATQERELNGCPVSVSSLTFTPKMMIRENENGSLTIVGGRDGKLLLTLAAKLNFTINLRYPSVEDQLKYSRKEAIRHDVATGISEIGIGRLRPTDHLDHSILISYSYDEECVTWGVPTAFKWSHNVVWVEFSWEVWAWVGLLFVIACVIKYAHTNTVTPRNGNRQDRGFVTVILDVLALHLGNPITYAISSLGGRFMLLAYLYYAIVITTAYKTSLASILATDEGTPVIVNAEGIIKANIKVGGSLYDYRILRNQANESEVTSQLLERFVINNNDTVVWSQLFSDQDWAILGRRSLLNYRRQMIVKDNPHIDFVNFYVLKDCVLAHPTVMLFHSRSFILGPVDNLIRRLLESGIPNYWDVAKIDVDKLLKRKSAERYFEHHAVHKFWNIFILYFWCIVISLLTFFIELLV